MGAVRIVILAVAAVFAIGLAFIVRELAGHKPPPPPPPPVVVNQPASQPMAQVLVARRDLPTGARVAQGDLGWQGWPVSALNPTLITDGAAPEATPSTSVAVATKTATRAVAVAAATVVGGPMEARYGSIVREPILANEPVTDAKLVRGGEGGYMAVVLHPGMRAVAIPISVATAAGGFILPGDRVDVIQTHASDGGTSGHSGVVAQVLLRNIRVLAIDQGSKPIKDVQTMVGGVATLEVPAQDAEVLARAKTQGEVILSLRAYADAGGASGAGPGGGDAGVVRILRNGQSSEVMVTP